MNRMACHFLLVTFSLILMLSACQSKTTVSNKSFSPDETGISTYKIDYRTTLNKPESKRSSEMTQWVDKHHQRYAIFTKTSNLTNGKLREVNSLMLSEDDWSFVINLDEKLGLKTKNKTSVGSWLAYIQPEDEESMMQLIKEDHGKIIGTEVVLGRSCIVIEMADFKVLGEKQFTKVCFYKGIPLRISNLTFTMEAVGFI